jgi:hypothetical protein
MPVLHLHKTSPIHKLNYSYLKASITSLEIHPYPQNPIKKWGAGIYIVI